MTSMHLNYLTSSNPAVEEAVTTAVSLNNSALALSNVREYARAIPLHQQAIAIKVRAYGEVSSQAALSYNALGEAQFNLARTLQGDEKAERLDQAEKSLRKAMVYRETERGLDAAVTRENLGQVMEEMGRMDEARNIRRRRGTDYGKEVCCGNYSCPHPMGLFPLTSLKACSKCSSVFYCSRECQVRDWTRHKTPCKAYTAKSDRSETVEEPKPKSAKKNKKKKNKTSEADPVDGLEPAVEALNLE